MKSKIFISYSRCDLAFAQSFVAEIEKAAGIKPWVDLSGVETGEQFTDVIIQAIDSCEIFVFLISRSSLESPWTKKEVLYAKDCNKKIYPIIIDGAEPHGWFRFEFGRIDCINYAVPEQREKLLDNLAQLFSERREASAEDVFLSKARRFKTNDGVIDADERAELERLAAALGIGAVTREALIEKVECEYESPSGRQAERASEPAGGRLPEDSVSPFKSFYHRYLQLWKGIFDYRGRSGRLTYWVGVCGHLIAFLVVCVLDVALNADFTMVALFAFACVFPWLALCVRRARDAGLSPWVAVFNGAPLLMLGADASWVLLCGMVIVLGCLPGRKMSGRT